VGLEFAISQHFIIIEAMKHFSIILTLFFLISCRDTEPAKEDIVKKPELLEDRIKENLQIVVQYAADNSGKINDSTSLHQPSLLKNIYNNNNYSSIWSTKGKWSVLGDSLYHFIENVKNYGLFPIDYNYHALSVINNKLKTDSLANKDAALLSRADVMMTDALLEIGRDLKRGKLPYDSLTTRPDTIIIDNNFYLNIFNKVLESKQVSNTLASLEPALPGYIALKEGIKGFIDSTEFRKYTYLEFPVTDSVAFYKKLNTRLYEEKLLDTLTADYDTVLIRKALTKYQSASSKLKTTGKINENTVKSLNNTAWEKFKRIAISLDKYKLMPDTMPERYVWVNIPGYTLKVIDEDTVALESRVIVGASKTRTPELQSDISNFITYPQWTVPYSIIFKEMLPQIQKDTNYLKKQNLMIVDKNDSVIPPSKIDWKKMSKKHFPYLIKQRQGDDNSLGVLKFNFRNKYSVYLHDTNARWLFSKTDRSLSHGCVRVQNWQGLAFYLVRNDSVKYNRDTITNWIKRQEKHVVSGFKKVPVYIRYFTCEGAEGRVKFYDDIYAEDKVLAEKYYSKTIY
jgi:L,D-transpeptidase YcbB